MHRSLFGSKKSEQPKLTVTVQVVTMEPNSEKKKEDADISNTKCMDASLRLAGRTYSCIMYMHMYIYP